VKRKAIVYAAHADDGEIGCGGTIARLKEEGWYINYYAFTLPPYGFREEFENAVRVFGVNNGHCFNVSDPRYLDKERQIVLDYMVVAAKDNYDLVFVPNSHDTHQDHEVVRNEAFRAFKETTILGYELPWNNQTFDTDCFYVLKKSQLDKKIQAMKQYKSQAHRSYFKNAKQFVYGLAQTRGLQINAPYAEAFEVIREVK